MRFTIDQRNLDGVCKRLRKHGAWRDITPPEPIMPDDLTFETAVDAQAVLSRLTASSDNSLPGKITPDYFAVVHRDQQPPIPSYDELRDAIRNGNDLVNNVLVLTIDGHFRLRGNLPLPTDAETPDTAVRHETFAAGGDYVGAQAAEDLEFLKDTYLAMLDSWLIHLETGETCLYRDYPCAKSEDELLKAIQHINETQNL